MMFDIKSSLALFSFLMVTVVLNVYLYSQREQNHLAMNLQQQQVTYLKSQIYLAQKQNLSKPRVKSIRLKAILYLDEHNWCIWLNDKKITSSNCPNHIQIKAIANDSIDFAWMEGPVKYDISLKVNESFEIADAH